MAAVLTRATRDGDTWIIDGAKMWTTGAGNADYGMCLARTDWDAPKHKGLSMFAVPLKHPDVTIEPIIGIEGGPAHFFQEFFDGVSATPRQPHRGGKRGMVGRAFACYSTSAMPPPASVTASA